MENIRVYYRMVQSSGYSKDEIKLFNNKSSARIYALKLLKDLKNASMDTDDDEAVIIEDINSGDVIEAWRNEGEGKVEHYPKGW